MRGRNRIGSWCGWLEQLEHRRLLAAGAALADGTLTIIGGAGDDAIGVALDGGSIVVTLNSQPTPFPAADVAQIVVKSGAGDDALDLAAPRPYTVNAGTVTPAEANVVDIAAGAAVTFSATQQFASLTIAGSAGFSPGGPKVLMTRSLTFSGTGSLDLADGDLLLDYTADSPIGTWAGSAYTGVRGMVAAGQIFSSSVGAGVMGVGVAEASDALQIAAAQTALFSGQRADATSALVKVTWLGDATLDGRTNIDDYGRIDSMVSQSGSVFGWFNGDFNYDGKINIDDYGGIDSNLQPVAIDPPALQASTIEVDFGQVVAGAFIDASVTLTNPAAAGGPSVTILGTGISGSSSFTDTFDDATDLVLELGQSAVVSVRFAPTLVGAVAGELAIAHDGDGSPIAIALAGEGLQANRAPVLAPVGNQSVEAGTALSVPISAIDPDGNDLAFSASSLPSFAVLTDHGNGTATLLIEPPLTASGAFNNVTVTATDAGAPALGDSELFSITVTPSSTIAVQGLTLINADTDLPIGPLVEGAVINFAQLGTSNLNVRADVASGTGSVRFGLDADDSFRVESDAPFALAGDDGSGNYNAWVPSTGTHALSAIPYGGSAGTGAVGATVSVNFTVITGDDGGGPTGFADQIHLSLVQDPSSTMTVVWRTMDTATASTVQYRVAGGSTWLSTSGAQRLSGTTGKLHETTLTGLTPSTSYEYRVRADDNRWSPIFVTRTMPAPGPADFEAIYFADTGLIGRLDGLANGTAQAIAEITQLDPELLLGGGDYAYFNTDTRFGTLDNTIDQWFNQNQSIFSRAPIMPTYGNHEVLLGEGYDAWQQRFATPSGYDNARNYSFDVGETHFVSILAESNNGALRNSSIRWITADMAAAQAAGKKWIVPFFHVSPFSSGSSHPSNTTLRAQLGPLFEQYGVKVAISSHDQNVERTFPLVDVPTTNTPTDTDLTGYDAEDGVTWIKVSPAGKLSNHHGVNDFSKFTVPQQSYMAFRDDTMHHFARLVFTASGTLRVETYGFSGDGTPAVVVDSFEYNLGAGSAGALMRSDGLAGTADATTDATTDVVRVRFPASDLGGRHEQGWTWNLPEPIRFDSLLDGSPDALEALAG